MCQFIETIKVQDRELQNIDYHNKRFNQTLNAFWGSMDFIDLKKVIQVPGNLDNKVYKCRIVYSKTIRIIEFLPYKIRPVSSLTVVINDQIEYKFKYLDRSYFEKLLINVKTDDILIVKNGYITDTSFSNIIFYDGVKWLTPNNPLLSGTKRNFLIDNNIIFSEELKFRNMKLFKKAKLINAMIDFDSSSSISMNNFY